MLSIQCLQHFLGEEKNILCPPFCCFSSLALRSNFFVLNALVPAVFTTFSSSVIFIHVSKLGVPIKTTVSATVLEEALKGAVIIHPLPLGMPISKRVSYFFISISCGSFFLLPFINFR